MLLGTLYCLHSYASCQVNGLKEREDKNSLISFVSYQQSLDSSCWIKYSEIAQLYEATAWRWIDVRTRAAQKALPLDGLLTIPLHTLTNQQWLQQQPILLVGTGFDQVELNKVCTQVKQAGFKTVYALKGGAYVLAQSHSQQHEITAEQYWFGSMIGSWKTVVIDLTDLDLQHLPSKPFKQFVSSTDNIQLMIQQILSQLTDTSPIQLVLITKDQSTTQQWQQLLNTITTSKRIVWLQGGIQNYNYYIEQQQSIRSNAGKTFTRPCS